MKPDADYTRKLLAAFEDAPKPTTDIEELQECGLDYRQKEFMFHLRLLNDDGFVQQEDGEPGIGLSRSVDGMYSWSVVPLRLTSSGHEFAVATRSRNSSTRTPIILSGRTMQFQQLQSSPHICSSPILWGHRRNARRGVWELEGGRSFVPQLPPASPYILVRIEGEESRQIAAPQC